MKTFTKFGLAAVSATLLAFGAATPAFAADINVGPSDVAGFENGAAGHAGFNYTQWHVGSEHDSAMVSTDSLGFNECGVTILGVPTNPDITTTQVLLGFENRPSTAAAMNTSELEALFNSISIDVAQGTVTIQVPMFVYEGGDMDIDPEFTTFRNADWFGQGVHHFADATLTDSSSGGFNTFTSAELFTFLAEDIALDDDVFEILGVGFNGSPGAVVNSISFGGNTYHFGTGNCAPAAPTAPTKVQTAAQ